ncbi:MAG: hypothetical protein S4CHLAM6_04820 [Chlamydiae bacterium]|nr:hypothetical protein [Chlamydiota bacterium]
MTFSDPGINPSSIKRQAAMENMMRKMARQETSQEDFMLAVDEGNQYIASLVDKEMKAKAKTLEQRANKDGTSTKEAHLFGMEETDVLPFRDADLNPELDAKTLLILKAHISETDTSEEVLEKVLEAYSDFSVADDALEYLEKISEDKMLAQIKKTRSDFNETFGREIKAGKNISQEARAFASQGLGNANALRDLYRDITGSPRTPNKLFEELSQQFPFEKLKKVIKFLLNSLGRDLKAKGSSIPKALLFRLLTETRNLQAILAVYLFFKGRMNLVFKGFDNNELYFPKQLSFELMAKLFMQLLDDRYPTAVKVVKLAEKMGIDEEIVAQVIVFTQFRDAIRNVAPKLYRNVQHRQELLNAYMDALEELDEALDTEYEEEE